MDAFSLIQHFFTQMQCPHCGQHLNEEGVQLLREEDAMFLVHVECHHCHSEIGNAMVGMESASANMMRRHFGRQDTTVIVEIDEEGDETLDEIDADEHQGEIANFINMLKQSQKMPRFAGAAGMGTPRRRYKDPELSPEEKERLSQFDPVSTDDVIEAHQFFSGLGRNWMEFIPEEMRQLNTASEAERPTE